MKIRKTQSILRKQKIRAAIGQAFTLRRVAAYNTKMVNKDAAPVL
jgi:hypothetical protein